jgi:hypothetical protein
MATTSGYRGYTFSVVSDRLGWRLSIFAPNSTTMLTEPLDTRDPQGLNGIMAEARRIVDSVLTPTSCDDRVNVG